MFPWFPAWLSANRVPFRLDNDLHISSTTSNAEKLNKALKRTFQGEISSQRSFWRLCQRPPLAQHHVEKIDEEGVSGPSTARCCWSLRHSTVRQWENPAYQTRKLDPYWFTDASTSTATALCGVIRLNKATWETWLESVFLFGMKCWMLKWFRADFGLG